MQNLRETDGARAYETFARFHIRACRRASATHTFASAMERLRDDLLAQETKVRDLERARDDARADVTFADQDAEKAISLLFDDAGKLDRTEPALEARKTLFPDGLRPEKEPRGVAQAEALRRLRGRLAKGKLAKSAIAADHGPGLETLEKALRAAIEARTAAERAVEGATFDEREVKRKIREQAVAAHGGLTALFKSKKVADQAFPAAAPRPKKGKATPGTATPAP